MCRAENCLILLFFLIFTQLDGLLLVPEPCYTMSKAMSNFTKESESLLWRLTTLTLFKIPEPDIFLDWLEQCVYIGKTKLFIFFVNFSFLKDLRDTLNYTLYTSYWGNSFTIISCSWLSLLWWWLWIVSLGSPLTSATFSNKHFFDKGRGLT